MKKLILCLFFALAIGTHSAKAQFFSIVFDPSDVAANINNVRQSIQQYIKLVQQLNKMRQQVQYTIKSYRRQIKNLTQLPNRSWNSITDIERNLDMVERSAQNMAYMRQFIKNKYEILYNTEQRLRAIKQNPQLAFKMKKKRTRHLSNEANKVIAVSDKNIELTKHSYQVLKQINNEEQRSDLTPMQMRQIKAKTQALSTQQIIEVKRIIARNAAFQARQYRMSVGERLDREARLKVYEAKFKNDMRRYGNSSYQGNKELFPDWAKPNSY
jgi:P-type conjugative transfer protein TrbJ